MWEIPYEFFLKESIFLDYASKCFRGVNLEKQQEKAEYFFFLVTSGIVQGCQNDKILKGKLNREQVFRDYKPFIRFKLSNISKLRLDYCFPQRNFRSCLNAIFPA